MQSFTIQKLVTLIEKGKEMRLKDYEYLNICINVLKTYKTNIFIPESIAKTYIKSTDFIYNNVINGVIKEFCINPTPDQSEFIKYILPSYLSQMYTYKLQEVMKIYDLNFEMEFSYWPEDLNENTITAR